MSRSVTSLGIVEFVISPERRPRSADEVLVTEPRASSDRIRALKRVQQFLSAGEIVDRKLNVGSGRSRFCIDSPMLRNGINKMLMG